MAVECTDNINCNISTNCCAVFENISNMLLEILLPTRTLLYHRHWASVETSLFKTFTLKMDVTMCYVEDVSHSDKPTDSNHQLCIYPQLIVLLLATSLPGSLTLISFVSKQSRKRFSVKINPLYATCTAPNQTKLVTNCEQLTSYTIVPRSWYRAKRCDQESEYWT